MKIIDRYLIRGFIWPFLYCLSIFLFLYVIIDLFGHLDVIIKQDIPPAIIKTYYLSCLPFIFVQTAPFSVLLATVFILGNLNRHNEITALKASGINSLRIIAPLLMFGVVICLAVYLINDRIVPAATVGSNTIKELYFEKGQKDKTERLENITVFGRDGKLFYARSYDIPNKTLYDVVILEHDLNGVLKRKITADRMQWSEEDNWRFFNCNAFRFDKNGVVIGKPAIFKTPKIIKFSEKPDDMLKRQVQPEFMNYAQLRDYIKLLSLENTLTSRKLFVELHYKLALPLTSLVIMLIGIPFALKRTRGGAMMSMGISLVIAMLFYGTNAVLLALGKGGLLPPVVSAWTANIIFAGLGMFLITKGRA